jgi:hypothetical protein
MKTIVEGILLFACCIAASGCIGLQHRTVVVRYGVEGRLLEVGGLTPLANVLVRVSVNGRDRNVTTSAEGEFSVPPETKGFWT